MVLLHIISNEKQQADDIADLLVKENLVISAVSFQTVSVRQKLDNGDVGMSDQILIIGRTRGVLFTTIEERLKETFSSNTPILYSVPIVNMNWEEADVLSKGEQNTNKIGF